MAKNVKTAATKSRETKLGKKSTEELIQIILRKDKCERNLSTQVTNLKGEVNSLTKRVQNFDKDQEGNIREIRNLRDSNKTKQETIDNLRIQLNDSNEEYINENRKRVEAEDKVISYKFLAYAAIVTGLIVGIIGWLL